VAAPGPDPPLSHAGRWITDASGRVVIIHGVNEVYKVGSYAPADIGFDGDDAKFLERNGFNGVRLGVIYKGVEPNPPTAGRPAYDDAYLARIADTQKILAHRRIFSLIDFHQDLFNERFQGEGWPDWQVRDDGLPNPRNGFPGNYASNPALNRAFDHFWANDLVGGVRLQDEYAAAWRHVAERFAGSRYVLGYDILNEPWPGSAWPACFSASGCPAFEQSRLTTFSKLVIAAIRQADPATLVFYEPLVMFNFAIPTQMGDVGDSRAGFSFHDYCGAGCDDDVFATAVARAEQTGDAPLNTEFGATDDLAELGRVVAAADAQMTGWMYWQYSHVGDITTTGNGEAEAIVFDPSKPPSGANVDLRKLRVLARPYPQAVAGTPEDFGFDSATRTFELRYSTEQAAGTGRFGDGSVTEVSVPALHYPQGYAVEATGARVISGQGADVLRLRTCGGAQIVEAQITPGRLGPSARKC
jgi:endoglycosylceramidase